MRKTVALLLVGAVISAMTVGCGKEDPMETASSTANSGLEAEQPNLNKPMPGPAGAGSMGASTLEQAPATAPAGQ